MDLLDLSAFVLHNLNSIDEPGFMHTIISRIKKTTAEVHLVFYEFSLSFFRKNDKYPSPEFLSEKFEDFPTVEGEFLDDYFYDFINQIDHEHLKLDVSRALIDRDYEAIGDALEQIHIFKDEDDVTLQDALARNRLMLTQPAGCPFGIKTIDDVIYCVPYGTLTVLAAPPSMGKTTMSLSFIYNAVFHQGYNAVFLTFEELREVVWNNLMSLHSRNMGKDIPAETLIKGLFDEELLDTLDEVAEDFEKRKAGNLEIISLANLYSLDFMGMNRTWRKYEKKMGSLDIIWVDYIQLMRGLRPKWINDPKDFLNDVVSYFAKLSKVYNSKGLMVGLNSQINRKGETRLRSRGIADMSVLAEVNALERDADLVIIILATESERLDGSMRVQVLKHRKGRPMDHFQELRCEFPYGKILEKMGDQEFRDSALSHLPREREETEEITDDIFQA